MKSYNIKLLENEIICIVLIQILLFVFNYEIEKFPQIELLSLLYYLIYSAIAFFISIYLFYNKKNSVLFILILIILNFFSFVKESIKYCASFTNNYNIKYFLYSFYIFFIIYIVYRISKKILIRQISMIILIILSANIISNMLRIFEIKNTIKNDNSIEEIKYSNSNLNIVFVIFDSYTSNFVLENRFRFQNKISLDTNKYSFQTNSKSNFLQTVYSMSEIFNIKNNLNYSTYEERLNSIKNSKVIRHFKKSRYNIYNYSFFEINQSIKDPNLYNFMGFNDLKKYKKMYLNSTFIYQAKNSIIFFIFRNIFENDFFNKISQFIMRSHLTIINKTKNNIFNVFIKEKSPFFLYGHFLVPHDPFCFDSIGNVKNNSSVYFNMKSKDYIDNVKFSNKIIEEIILNFEEAKLDTNTILVIQGDHGARVNDIKLTNQEKKGILNIVYIPNRDYSFLNDTISNYNTMEIILKKHFNYK